MIMRVEQVEADRRLLIFAGVGFGNLLLFVAIGMLLGGTAPLGQASNHQYFLGDHGRMTQVPLWIYSYSWIHTMSQFITFPLGIYAAGVHTISRLTRS